jgi:alpha-galactosidase
MNLQTSLKSLFALSLIVFTACQAQAQLQAATPQIAHASAPLASAPPSVVGPSVIGAKAQSPFIYLVPTVGVGPFKFSAQSLPTGLTLNASTGIITGTTPAAGEYALEISVENSRGLASKSIKLISGEGVLSQTPSMGWNSWNVWGCNVDDTKIRAAADYLVSSGLASHGFQFINIDDCWMGNRDANGFIHSNSKFPDMKALSQYVHSKGLKLGIYSSPGPTTCQGYTGSLGHELQDAQTYADWGIDYLKYDWCSYKGDYKVPYATMGDALKKVSRGIVYSFCQYGMDNVWEWGASLGGNSWRTTGDIEDTWQSISTIGFGQNGLEAYAGPGHWNDPDMLVVGNLGQAFGPNVHPTRLTQDEQITHITLWSMLSAPLLIGADLSALDSFTLDLLTNDEVLAIDQDALGKQAHRVSQDKNTQIWMKNLADGTLAMAAFNVSSKEQKVQVGFEKLGLSGTYSARNLWTKTDLGRSTGSITVTIPSHGVVLYKLSH